MSRFVMKAGLGLLLAVVVMCITACGGGSGGGNASNSQVTQAEAGTAQNVVTGSLVTLSGSQSIGANGSLIGYQWSMVSAPAGSAAVIQNATTVNPTFTADLPGQYLVKLIVTDDKSVTSEDTVTVTVSVANAAPVASAGSNQNVSTGALVTLNGSTSSDANSDLLTYSWTFTSKPVGSTATLSNATSAAPTFTPDVEGAYVVSLVVNDGAVNSAAATVTVTATVTNAAPVANAGSNQNVSTGVLVTLDGSASSDANSDLLTCSWAFTSKPIGSTATLSSATSATPTFTPDVAGFYVLNLVVNDGTVNSAAATVTVTATVANAAPVANAGTDQSVITGVLVTLDGSTSSDANSDLLTYSWTFTSKPIGSTATLSDSTSAAPTFIADVAGSYIVRLVVNDGAVNSAADSVTVTASIANAAPIASAGTDQNVITGVLVTLDGSSSSDANNDLLTYNWTFTSKPGGSTATLSNATSTTPAFTPDVAGSYIVRLVVNDGTVNSAAATVTVTASVANAAPVANAGTDQSVFTGVLVTLDGSASSDANSDLLTYNWAFTSKPAGSTATLSGSTSAAPTFTPDVPGSYVVNLVVNDGTVGSTIATVTVSASVANAAPIASAGTDQNVITGVLVTLDGSSSSDANNDLLTYNWTFTSKPVGSTATLSGATSASPTFTPDVAGSYVVNLIVNDGTVNSAAATVTVTAEAPNLQLSETDFFGTNIIPMPYTVNATSNQTLIGSPYATLATFTLTAVDGDFTISNLSAIDNTGKVSPSFNGLSNNQTITNGSSVTFSLISPLTSYNTVSLVYVFTVAETGESFTYNVTLRTN